MKSVYYRVLSFAVVALMAVVVGQAQAGTILMQDFEQPTITTGLLTNQDGWVVSNPGYRDVSVYSLPYGTGTVQAAGFAEATWPGGSPSEKRLLPSAMLPLTFHTTDTAIEQHMVVMSQQSQNEIYGGLAWDANGIWATTADVNTFAVPYFGISYSGGVLKTYLRTNAAGAPEYFGATLTAGHWYELKMVIDFSNTTLGGTTTYWYRDVNDPTNIPAFTQDTTIGTKTLNVPQFAGTGIYKADGVNIFFTRVTGTQNMAAYIDKFWVVDPVPEPSTLALLGMGLLGLLCYAWRKRK